MVPLAPIERKETMAETIPAKKGKKDAYANLAFASVTHSAANTLTFQQIQFAVGLFQGIAILLHRVLWFPSAAAYREIVAATDDLQMAITTSNRISAILDMREPAVIVAERVIGMGAEIAQLHSPIISDFTSLPQGGKLMPANPVYIASAANGFAAVQNVTCAMEFTFIELSPADYLELIQSQYPANVA